MQETGCIYKLPVGLGWIDSADTLGTSKPKTSNRFEQCMGKPTLPLSLLRTLADIEDTLFVAVILAVVVLQLVSQ